MARVDVGNDLVEPLLTFGWKVSDDGYGLRTCQATYNADNTGGMDFTRGEAFPVLGYEYLKLHKQTSTFGLGGIQLQVCDYVGIDPTVGEGLITNPQVSSSNGLTSENISTNPNFFEAGGDGYGALIAGPAGSFVQSPLGPLVEIKNTGDYVQVVAGSTVALVNKKQSYVGEHGACFESEEGGRFIGFVDPAFKHFYGKTNYLAAQSSFSGCFYTTEANEVQNILSYLGTTSYDNDWAGTLPLIVPEYAGTSWHASAENGGYDQLLLAQVNVEDFGALFKVNYEVRFSIQGWPDEVYRKSSIM
jgi:hypothetical protein